MIFAADVAKFILENKGTLTAMKLQKLVYYSQAWSLAWDGVPLFKDPIQAWANGPVVYSLYELHKGKYKVTAADFGYGNAAKLDTQQRETVLSVLSSYGDMTASQLSELTHAEKPWRIARGNVDDGVRSQAVITLDSVKDYYTQLSASKDAVQDVSEINFPIWSQQTERSL